MTPRAINPQRIRVLCIILQFPFSSLYFIQAPSQTEALPAPIFTLDTCILSFQDFEK